MNSDKLKRSGFVNIALGEGYIWWCNVYNSTLQKMNIRTGEIRIETFLPAQSITGKLQYGPIVYYEENLLIAPRNAQKILIYNIKKQQLKEIDIEDFSNGERVSTLFLNVICYKHSVYFFPGRYFAIIKLNLQTGELTYYKKWYEEILAFMPKTKSVVCNSKPICIGQYCYFPLYQKDVIVKFNMDNGEYELHWLSKEESYITCMEYDEQAFWFTYANKLEIVRWDLVNNIKTVYSQLPKESNLEKGFSGIYICGAKVVVVPIKGDMLLKYDKITGNVAQFGKTKFLNEAQCGETVIDGWNFIGRFINGKEQLWLYSAYEDVILRINLKSEEIYKYDAFLQSPFDLSSLKNKCFEKEKILWEKYNISISDYIGYIRIKDQTEEIDIEYSVGNKIWRELN